ncbi:MAG TPA: four helix bundle protein [Candidatus Acidoferrum sp.]|nr:four helix bundle protein [Candidatus Acidoferrum sp.]
MNSEELKKRTKSFAIRVINLVDRLPESRATNAIAGRIVRSGTSVGANYRAACRAKSRADFISKLGNVEEECDETLYWMELLVASKKVKAPLVSGLMHEAGELLAITVSSINTARANKNSQSAIRNHQ